MLRQEGAKVLCLAPEDGFEENLRAIEGVRFLPFRHFSRKGLSLRNNFLTLLELIRLLRKERPDLAVFYTIKPNIFGAIAARCSGTASIATVEGLGYAATAPAWLRRFIFLLYRIAFRFVQKVIFLNRDDRAEFLRYRAVAAAKTRVIHGTGVDTDFFRPEEKTAGRPVFLFVGRLLSDKGIREFILAAALVKQAEPDARFQILGSPDAGNPASIPVEELQQLSRNENVEYLGPTEDVRPFIAGAGVVVLPSYREGMPRVLLEGLAMGKPVITTDSAGCRETVEDGLNGFIIPSENTGALAEAMRRFLRLSPSEQRAMGEYSRKKALREFGNHVVLPQYLELFRQVLTAR